MLASLAPGLTAWTAAATVPGEAAGTGMGFATLARLTGDVDFGPGDSATEETEVGAGADSVR